MSPYIPVFHLCTVCIQKKRVNAGYTTLNNSLSKDNTIFPDFLQTLNIVPDFLQTLYIIHSPSLVDWVSPKKKKGHQDEYHRPRNHQEAKSKAHVLRLVTGTTHVATQSTKLSHDQFNSCLCILLSSFKSRIYMSNIGTQQFSKKEYTNVCTFKAPDYNVVFKTQFYMNSQYTV